MTSRKFDIDPPQHRDQRGEDRPGPSPRSAHPTGPHAPFDDGDAQRAAQQDFARERTSPNRDGLVSANPVVLSKDGDATPGNGHGRDRDSRGPESG